ncbi:hypothetical protein E5288_WYG022837 [Bos mutus]|uniref:Uncharacterized protein n=1 Tax=Bos mutus TaxID=72004 RepID=A0A6B0SFR0_9CETA|nr:hypothetical protein [Bos mutus]
MEQWAIEPLEEEEESDFELEALEEEEHLLEEVKEEETVENDESEQESAAVVAGHRDPLEQFGPVFWGLVHSLLHSFSYDDHVLVWPPGPCPMVTHSSQPPSGPGEGPTPLQEREDLAEGGEASQGPEIISSTGCEIYWKDGKELTLKTLKLQKCEGPEEASDYQYEESDEEVQEAEGEEEDSDKKPEEGPGKDLDPAEDSPGEPRLSISSQAPSGTGLDSAAGFKLGYFPCQLLTPISASFCPNDEGEDQYENTDEEEEDGNEKPEGL